jgi:hypothetical protein
MIKYQELTNPRGCLNRAHSDEPIFVLLGRDVAAGAAIRAWIDARIAAGKNEPADDQIAEALRAAARFEETSRDGYVLGNVNGDLWIQCLTCGVKSFRQKDITERYCGKCHKFHGRSECGPLPHVPLPPISQLLTEIKDAIAANGADVRAILTQILDRLPPAQRRPVTGRIGLGLPVPQPKLAPKETQK